MRSQKKTNSFLLLASGGLALALGLRAASRRLSRYSFQGKTVIITGGSRGLGLVLARQLAEEGARLVLLARDPDELSRAQEDLQDLAAAVMVIPCDIRDRQQVSQALTRVFDRYQTVDVLINNAGIIQVSPIEHVTLNDFESAMGVHFWGPLYAIWELIPHMQQRGAGRIVNITSIGGRVAVPHLAPYTASKFAMVGLSNALRAELAKDGISITTVVPGLMRTGSHVNALFKGHHEQEYTWFSVFDALPISSTSATRAASQIIEACRDGKPYIVITPQARLLILLNSIFPGINAGLMKLFNRLLPGPNTRDGNQTKPGLHSQSRWSPSVLTSLADQASFENNELPGTAVSDWTDPPALSGCITR